MDESILIDKLILFGLSRQEAVIYLCLLKNGELTGYEVAKLTGISRSNVYNSISTLVDHGAAYVVEGTATKYTPVPMDQFCNNRIRYLKEVENYLVMNCPRPAPTTEGYVTVEGYFHICDKIHHMLLGAKQRIYFSADSVLLEQWQEELTILTERKIKVVLLSDKQPECLKEEIEKNSVFFYNYQKVRLPYESLQEEKGRQLRLIIDSALVLTGEVLGSSTDTCLYSAQRNFVEVFKEAMHNEMKLIEIEAGK